MSWAEIKKAVNDDMSTPLSKQLGFQRVAGGVALITGSSPYLSISGFTGLMYVHIVSSDVTIKEDDADVTYLRRYTGYSPWALLPISKDHTYKLYGTGGTYYFVYALGGGI